MKTVSVIIPVLNEEQEIVEAITQARTLRPLEILVADGGSTDRTRSLAESLANAFFSTPKGRAAQMNYAARHAKGDILLFLHADCRLNANALEEARKVLDSPGTIAGCFRMKINAPGLGYRMIEKAAFTRVTWGRLIYGDQGLFLTRQEFFRLGGFPPYRFMEDLFFSKTLAAKGKLGIAQAEIIVSPRRWEKQGLLRQTLRNSLLTAMALVGIHPDCLARFYPPPCESPRRFLK